MINDLEENFGKNLHNAIEKSNEMVRKRSEQDRCEIMERIWFNYNQVAYYDKEIIESPEKFKVLVSYDDFRDIINYNRQIVLMRDEPTRIFNVKIVRSIDIKNGEYEFVRICQIKP